MNSVNYFLLLGKRGSTVVHAETGLRVDVFNLSNSYFTPAGNELFIFGDYHDDWLVFVTQGCIAENLIVISGAILWYANYINYPQMHITYKDPRIGSKLHICQ